MLVGLTVDDKTLRLWPYAKSNPSGESQAWTSPFSRHPHTVPSIGWSTHGLGLAALRYPATLRRTTHDRHRLPFSPWRQDGFTHAGQELRAGRVNRKIRQRMNQLHSFLHDVLLAVFASLESSRTRWDTPSTVYARLARDRTCERNFEHERPSVLGTTLLHECIKILYSENGEPAIWNHH